MSGDAILLENSFMISPGEEEDALVTLQEGFEEAEEAESLEEAMSALGFELDRDSNDHIYRISSLSDRFEIDALFEIGSYVQRGSFVVIASGDDEDDLTGIAFSGERAHEWEPTGEGDEPDLDQLDEWDEEFVE